MFIPLPRYVKSFVDPVQASVQPLQSTLSNFATWDCLTQEFEEILSFIEEDIDTDLEHLSEGGADRMFQHLSTIFQLLYLLMSKAQTPSQADEEVWKHALLAGIA